MGEKIKILSKGKIQEIEFEIELNHPQSTGQDQQIHIQSDKFRFELGKKDFIKYSLSILVAEKNLKILKDI
jgi:hypothetical protein